MERARVPPLRRASKWVSIKFLREGWRRHGGLGVAFQSYSVFKREDKNEVFFQPVEKKWLLTVKQSDG